MEWILVVTLMIGGNIQIVEVKPNSEWMCQLTADIVKEKSITINGRKATVVDAVCVQE